MYNVFRCGPSKGHNTAAVSKTCFYLEKEKASKMRKPYSSYSLETYQVNFYFHLNNVNQLLSITHTIFKAFDCNPPLDVCSVYLDISTAFDRVWHDGLIYK